MKAADPPKGDHLIVPGWRVDKVYISMSSAALFSTLGDPDEKDRRGEYIFASWKLAGVNVFLNAQYGYVEEIAATSDLNRTTEGVHN